MSAILPYRNCFYKWTKYNSKQSHDTTAILISLWCALRLDQLFSTIYEKLNIWHFYEVSVVRLWWTSENHVSRYLFLEQIAHFLEGVLTFLRKAGDLIQRFSESTHIDVLNKACKMMKVRKKLNSFSSNEHLFTCMINYYLNLDLVDCLCSWLLFWYDWVWSVLKCWRIRSSHYQLTSI